MDNYISREIAVTTLQNSHERQAKTLREESLLAEDIRLLKELPAADVRPVVYAYWTTDRPNERNKEWHCSNCKYEPQVFENSNFCPNCGAEMRGGSDNGEADIRE